MFIDHVLIYNKCGENNELINKSINSKDKAMYLPKELSKKVQLYIIKIEYLILNFE